MQLRESVCVSANGDNVGLACHNLCSLARTPLWILNYMKYIFRLNKVSARLCLPSVLLLCVFAAGGINFADGGAGSLYEFSGLLPCWAIDTVNNWSVRRKMCLFITGANFVTAFAPLQSNLSLSILLFALRCNCLNLKKNWFSLCQH